MSYSQNDEEQFILNFFQGRTGKLLDIGAYDGIQLSNTRRLLELGWSGVLVEPAPHNVDKLIKNCRSLPPDNITIIQAAVSARGESPRLEQLFIDETPNREWSTTINHDLAFKVGSVMQPSPIKLLVPVMDIHAFHEYGPFQFINIDAEWEDGAILDCLILGSLVLDGCELICIEPTGLPQRDDMRNRLKYLGFDTLHETPENILAGRRL